MGENATNQSIKWRHWPCRPISYFVNNFLTTWNVTQTCRLHTLYCSFWYRMQFDFAEKQIKGRPFHAACDMCRWQKRTEGCNQALHLLLLCNNPDLFVLPHICDSKSLDCISVCNSNGSWACFRCTYARPKDCQTSMGAPHFTRNNWSSWRVSGGAVAMLKGISY